MTNKEFKKALKICSDIRNTRANNRYTCDDCPYDDTKNCTGTLLTAAREHITEQENEITLLQAKNIQLTEQLKKVLLSIDTVKEMNAMVNIHEQIKQAKIDVLNKLKDYVNQLACDEYGDSACDTNYITIDIDKYEQDIDEMIAEV